jgi:excisionase family DNA binding protein
MQRRGRNRTNEYEVKPMSEKSTPSPLQARVKTLNEVASLLRISRGSAYEAAKRKEIPTIRIGRRLLVPSDALERLLSGKTADDASSD